MYKKSYVYVLLNPLEEGEWRFKDIVFKYKPFYIGKGVGYRCTAHFTESSLNKDLNLEKTQLIKNILSQNIKPMIYKIAIGISDEEALKIEYNLIKHFGKVKEGNGILLNITDGYYSTKANIVGGENIHSKKVYEYDEYGFFVKEWECLRCINVYDIHYNTIGDSCRSNIGRQSEYSSANGKYWFYEYKGSQIYNYKLVHKGLKKVYKYCLGDLELKEVFLSLKEASIKEGKTKNSISKSCLKSIKLCSHVYSYTKLSYEDLIKIKSRYNYYTYNNKGIFTLSGVSNMCKINKNKIRTMLNSKRELLGVRYVPQVEYGNF